MFLTADDVLHQHKPVDESVCSQLKDSEETADKKPRDALRVPCSSVALSNPLHSLLSVHRRCKDTIVLTVLQPHQVSIMRHSLAIMFLSLRISLTLPQSCSKTPAVPLNHTETHIQYNIYNIMITMSFSFLVSPHKTANQAHKQSAFMHSSFSANKILV